MSEEETTKEAEPTNVFEEKQKKERESIMSDLYNDISSSDEEEESPA